MKKGDLVLVRGPSFMSRVIRYFGKCKWSHAAVCMDDTQVVESDAVGVVISPLTKYQVSGYEYIVIDINRSQEYRDLLVAKMESHLGAGYDYALAVGDFLYRVIGHCARFVNLSDVKNRWICTELVAESMRECGEDFGEDVRDMTPDDIAKHFGVEV